MPVIEECPEGYRWDAGCGCSQQSGQCIPDTHWAWVTDDGRRFPCNTEGCMDDSQAWLSATSWAERFRFNPPMRRITT